MKTLPLLLLTPLLALACSDPDPAVSPDGSVADMTISADGVSTDAAGTSSACAPSKALLARVDAARMLKDLNFLEGLGERKSHGAQVKAAAYLLTELKKLSGVSVKEHTYSYSGAQYTNLEATVAGTSKTERWTYFGAHYDSTSSDSTTDAPGADDNASGTAAVLELARALAGCAPAKGIRLVFFSNEEKGTVGSQAYVKDLQAVLPSNKMRGYINVDTIGFGPADEDLDLATRTKYKTLADDMAKAVEKWTTLKTNKIVSDHCG